MLEQFGGGHVIIGVTSTPFKCPPAPSETALLVSDYLTERGLRETLGGVAGHAPPGSDPAVAGRVGRVCSPRLPNAASTGIPTSRSERSTRRGSSVLLADGGELPYDLFLGVPVHRAPAVVESSGLCVDGWIPVDPLTLETAFPGVYAVGDVTSVGTPKAGVFAEGQAAVVADGDRRAASRPRGDPRRTTGAASVTWSSAHDQVGACRRHVRER